MQGNSELNYVVFQKSVAFEGQIATKSLCPTTKQILRPHLGISAFKARQPQISVDSHISQPIFV